MHKLGRTRLVGYSWRTSDRGSSQDQGLYGDVITCCKPFVM
ncbi:hypothetical protein Hdeb2414_s0018g00515291 [Helianthus debilis subsp. tardiflorus]